MFTRGRIALSVLAVSALALVGCSDAVDDATTTGSAPATETSAAAETATDSADVEGEDAEWVTFTEGFVKAKPAEKEMTGIFGIFANNSDRDINIVGFTSNLDVPTYELHEVVDGVMQMKPGGFVIPAGGEHELKPGGDHMMLMDYTEPIEAGDTITITVEFGDGSTQEIADLPVRTIASGEESYGADGSLQGHQMGQTEDEESSEMSH
ncbi:MAG: copper chaperone PCu(A)C [Corynebacterium sp.]|uniref:copper chaperone PCu(A)C n=1 Tax=Corynebacterium sp. TaxID=1720 RepID=UPI0026E0C7A7|nr:copper chaperone PCu(A)C [Corynebacterium sp.]MDO5670619.1 copper chaperone PCu(A)C [Corynebacterium sp.]